MVKKKTEFSFLLKFSLVMKLLLHYGTYVLHNDKFCFNNLYRVLCFTKIVTSSDSTFEAATSCAHIIKWTAVVLRNCRKTRLFDLPLRPSIGIKHLRIKIFLMAIAPSNWGNVRFPMLPEIPPASDQWGGGRAIATQ